MGTLFFKFCVQFTLIVCYTCEDETNKHHPEKNIMTKKLTKRQEKAQAKTEAAKALLVKATKELMDSGKYIEALNYRRSFHNYSFRNMLLIMMQLPTATMVASYNAWEKRGRQVMKGETGLSILAPRIVKDKKSENPDDKICIGYRTVSVFDVSQTEGDDIPTAPAPQMLTGDSKAIQEATQAAIEFVVDQGWTISFTELNGPKGYWDAENQLIAIEVNNEPAQQLKTLVHEIAHALLGHGTPDNDTPRHVAELQAESTAYLVCDAIGLDTSDYSFAYLAGWALDDTEAILKAANTADKIATQITEALSLVPA